MVEINLPQITTQIGSEIPESETLPFEELDVKVDVEKGESPCSVKLVFDLRKKHLYFEFHARNKTKYELYYFGTNKANSAQIFLVRSLKKIKYLFESSLNDCYLKLEEQGMKNSELDNYLEQIKRSGLYVMGQKIREGFLSRDKWREVNSSKVILVYDNEEKKYYFSLLKKGKTEKKTVEKFIRESLALNPREKIAAVLPVAVLPDGSEVYLNEHPDYHTLVKKSLELVHEGEILTKSNHSENDRVCHLCLRKVPNVASEKYLTKLSRKGINKIFTTTTINSAKGIQKDGYEDSYAICQECYSELGRGERYIIDKLSGIIAGENVFILPEGLSKQFETYQNFPDVKKAVDFVFQAKDAEQWYKQAVLEAEEQTFTNSYTINLVFYRTDGTSIKILDTLEDVPPLQFVSIMECFAVWKNRMSKHLSQGMSLGKIYRIIPVRSNKEGIQLDIIRVLDIYKSLLLRHKISNRKIFEYALEAVEKGLSQIQRQDRKNDTYKNLLCYRYSKEESDFFIRDIAMSYLSLMQVLQEFNLLSNPIFRKGVMVRMKQISRNKEIGETIKNMEAFLEEQGFSAEAKGLFFLGTLLYRVAFEQYLKGHRTKPILKKINFQGMKSRDIIRLSADIVEKLVQYQKMTASSEALLSKFYAYYGATQDHFELDELQNVFFVLSGYGYMVGVNSYDKKNLAQQDFVDDSEKETSE